MVFINKPVLTVDALILYDEDSIVLIKRKNEPYKGLWALPGGFVEYGETVEEAVIREAKEETGLDIKLKSISGVYSTPDRDPRGHIITICYLAHRTGGELKADTDATQVKCIKIKEALKTRLAFDHEQIIKEGLII
ncbi:MAG: NUDIX hydrolase [Methanobacterium sp.]|nr:NUDIX hydrolase [Methanobacterium sp.]